MRVEFFGDEIEGVSEVDQLTGEVLTTFDEDRYGRRPTT